MQWITDLAMEMEAKKGLSGILSRILLKASITCLIVSVVVNSITIYRQYALRQQIKIAQEEARKENEKCHQLFKFFTGLETIEPEKGLDDGREDGREDGRIDRGNDGEHDPQGTGREM